VYTLKTKENPSFYKAFDYLTKTEIESGVINYAAKKDITIKFTSQDP